MAKYIVPPAMLARLENEGTYHAPIGDQESRYEQISEFALQFKLFVVENTPASREQSAALTAIDEATFFANSAIARHESE
jgi:hypothetical protein